MSDYMVRATAADAMVRLFVCSSKELVEEARKIHNTTPVVTAALGRLLTAGAMMGSMLKNEKDLLTIQIKSSGPIGGLTVTATPDGMVKGYPICADVELPLKDNGKLDVGTAMGIGVMNVIKDMGLKLGLITNGPHNLQYRKLELLGITDMFDEIIVSGDFGADKPDVSIFEEMASRMNMHPNEMLYIGDNPENDIEPSRKVGYTPIWIKTTGNWVFPQIEKPKLQSDTVEAIPEIIKKLNERKRI